MNTAYMSGKLSKLLYINNVLVFYTNFGCLLYFNFVSISKLLLCVSAVESGMQMKPANCRANISILVQPGYKLI